MTSEISIVTPMFRAEKFIQRTIDSVLAQTQMPKDWVIVDDESPDQSAAIVQKFIDSKPPFPVRLLRQKNGGPGRARNEAIKNSTGKLVAFLDQDDTWFPEKIAETEKAFATLGPEFAGICHGERHVVQEGSQYRAVGEELYGPFEEPFYEVMLARGNRLSTSAIVVRRNALERSGLFDEDRNLFGVEDFDLWLRLAAVGKFHYIPKVLGDYLIGTGYSYINPRQRIHLSRLFWKHFAHPAVTVSPFTRARVLAKALKERAAGELQLKLQRLRSA